MLDDLARPRAARRGRAELVRAPHRRRLPLVRRGRRRRRRRRGGLLGRFDATNVADGRVAVVTNVGPDHTDFQGDWRRDIAEEKAGIIKPGATVVLGETDPELRAVFVDATDAAAEAMWERGERLRTATRTASPSAAACSTCARPTAPSRTCSSRCTAPTRATTPPVPSPRWRRSSAHPLGADLVRDALADVTVPGRFEIASARAARGARRRPQPRRRRPSPPRPSPTTSTSPAAGSSSSACWPPHDPAPFLDALDAVGADLVIACTPSSPRAVPASRGRGRGRRPRRRRRGGARRRPGRRPAPSTEPAPTTPC